MQEKASYAVEQEILARHGTELSSLQQLKRQFNEIYYGLRRMGNNSAFTFRSQTCCTHNCADIPGLSLRQDQR